MDVDNITEKLPDTFKVGLRSVYQYIHVHTKHCDVTPPTQTHAGSPGGELSETTGV